MIRVSPVFAVIFLGILTCILLSCGQPSSQGAATASEQNAANEELAKSSAVCRRLPLDCASLTVSECGKGVAFMACEVEDGALWGKKCVAFKDGVCDLLSVEECNAPGSGCWWPEMIK